jgi:gas vesicle protein
MAAVTANTLQITQQSAQLFEDANNSLGQIYSQVSEAQETLKGQAMVTTAGARLSQAIVLWTEDFNDIRNTLQQMATQLNDTAQQLAASNANSTDIAASVAAPAL